MSKIDEVRSISRNNTPHSWGAKTTYAEAEILLDQRFGKEHKEWAEKYHKRWWIEEIDTTGMFTLPTKPTPRERFTIREHELETKEGWDTLKIEVLNEDTETIATYNRNYPNMLKTFEPFRHGDKMFALISPDYTATSVLDLTTGEIIASETPHSDGFCPAGFYVPDW
jgi:hypothetical protein